MGRPPQLQDQKQDPLAARLPVLRDDLEIVPTAPQRSGAPAWVIFDPVSNRYFEIGRETLDMLVVWREGTVGDLLRRMKTEFGSAPDVAAVGEAVHFLIANALVRDIQGGDYRAMAEKVAGEKKAWWSTALHSYLFFRIPLFRPDRFLRATFHLVAPLFTRTAVWLFVLAGVAGLYLVSRQWDQFTGTFSDMLSWQGLALYGASLVFVKSCHELGHAYMSVRYKLRVPTIGIAFMVLMPVLYTDTSGAWRLRSRGPRLMIDAAGIFTELALAAVATLLWAFLPDGPVRMAVFAIATTSWITSLAVNLNPLMRFDGYYILSDSLGFQNLQNRSFAMARWRLREILFGLGEAPPEVLSSAMRRTVVTHAWATWIYRFFLFLGIAILVYAFFIKIVGILLFVVEIVWFIALPVWREMSHWWSIRSEIMSKRRILTTATVAVTLIAACVVPWSSRIAVPAFMTSAQEQAIFAPFPARIEWLELAEGMRVEKGAILAVLSAPQLDADVVAAQERMDLLEARIDRSGSDASDRASLIVLANELRQVKEELSGFAKLQDRLTVRAAFAGTITDVDAELHEQLWVGADTRLAVLQDTARPRVKGYIGEKDVFRVAEGSAVIFVPDDPDLPRVEARVTDVAQTGSEVLDEPYLALTFGGPIAIDEGAGDTLRPREAAYAMAMMPVDDTVPLPARAVRGVSLVEGASESLYTRARRQVLKVFVREFGV